MVFTSFFLFPQIVLFALVAAVYAEADPQFYSGLQGAYAGYGAYGAYGADIATTPFKSAPCVNAANVPVPCAAAGYGAYASPYALYGRKKREAEASAQIFGSPYGYAASPYAYSAGIPYAYGGAYSHPSNYGICTNYVGVQVPC